MQIDHDAPATAAGEIHVNASPAVVFEVLAAIGEWPSWNPKVKAATIAGPIRPGTEFRWKSGGTTLRSRLEVVEPPREIAWTGRTMGITAIHVFTFEPSAGGTRVCSQESWDGIVARMMRSSSRRTMSRAIDGTLARLKAEAERRAATA